METNVPWGFREHGTDVRPVHQAASKPWAKGPSAPGANDGTRLSEDIANRLVGNIRALALAAGATLTVDSDNDILACVLALIGITPPASHDHAGLYYPIGTMDELLAALQPLSAKGNANGYAGLDGSGKVPTAQLPDSVLGALAFQTFWNAATNSPALASGTGTKGHYYLVTTAGTTALDGIAEWAVGDWVVFDGSAWGKCDNTDAIASVAGLTGVISAAALKTALALAIADISGLQAALDAKVLTADVINALDSVETTKPLSAAQGKALDDRVDALEVAGQWTSKAVGEIVALHLGGLDTPADGLPPIDSPAFRYVLLTAGEDGVGEYNEGILTSESVSGVAPLVNATAVVDLDGSPYDGKTLHLINTERRFLRGGSDGTVENDQMQQITGSATVVSTRRTFAGGAGAISINGTASNTVPGGTTTSAAGDISFDSANSPNARAGGETRSKNIGATYVMRIK